MRRLIVLLIVTVLLIPCACLASNYYIAQTTSGLADGSSCANAYAYTWNWSGVNPGDTIYICGTIYGSSNSGSSTGITVAASGSSGSPITLDFCTTAICGAGNQGALTTAVWADSGAIAIANKSYITIEGNGVGVISNTANGSVLANQLASSGIAPYGVSHLAVQNLAFNNLYVRPPGSTDQAEYGYGVRFRYNGTGNTGSNNRVTNCTGHDMFSLVFLQYEGAVSTYEFDHNTAYNLNWGVAAGDWGTGSDSLSGILIHNNNFYNFSNWDDASTDTHYHNGASVWASHAGDTATNISYYNNMIGPNFGTYATSGLFSQYYVTGITAYNNLFLANSNDGPADGFIYWNPSASITGTYSIYNNTVLGGSKGNGIDFDGTGSGGTKTLTIQNNIFENPNNGIVIVDNVGVSLTSSYNMFYGLNASGGFCNSATSSCPSTTWTQWKAFGAGYDNTGSSVTDPLLNSNGSLQAGSPAIHAATNLTSLGITALDSDLAGTARPSSALGPCPGSTGCWDIGAYQYQALGFPATMSISPSGTGRSNSAGGMSWKVQ